MGILWWVVVWMGFRLLMETAEIMDLVMSCMAMSFVLSIDEMVQDTFGSNASMFILDQLDGYMYRDPEESTGRSSKSSLYKVAIDMDSDEEGLKLLDRYLAECPNRTTKWSKLVWMVIPKKLVSTIFLCCFCVAKYYYSKC